ncbi:uncharacterized protein LOC133533959 [Cydia pomonella]|uniref:uncharacterized protein LOC133533959 n=1 Tax=Cydia pomonella TaxID=82600 RepID=UPI002ADE7F5E|nr:uncharacterized protein LOC133533959 [Cydia pomonella]
MGESSKISSNPAILPALQYPQYSHGHAHMRPLEYSASMEEDWKLWVQKFKIFLLAENLDTVSDERKIALLLHNIGDKGVEIYNSFNLEEKQNFDDVLKKFNAYFIPKVNITMQRHKFFTRAQGPTESFDDFLTDLHNKSMTCNFSDKREELVRDVIVIGLANSAMKERLLRTEDLTLQRTVSMCRAAELSQKQVTELTNEIASTSVLNVTTAPVHNVNNVNTSKTRRVNTRKCYRCGNNWDRAHQCPAIGCKCQKCGIPNHFAKVCRNKQVATITEKQDEDDSEETFFIGCINSECE